MQTQPTRLTLIVVIALFAAACGPLGDRVDQKIESVGTELTGVPVRVERVKLKLGGGSGEITGFTVANPGGYTADYAWQMDLLRVNVGVLSLLAGPPLVLDEVVIDSPIVNFERDPQGGSNWKRIADNVKANREQADRKSAEEQPMADESPDQPLRIAVRRLRIEGVTINITRVDGTTLSGTLPTIELTDIGGAEGTTPAGLGKVVVLAMARETFKQFAAPRLREALAGAEIDVETLDTEKILAALEQKLDLSDEQLARVRPVLEQQSEHLRDAMDEAQAQGFLDLESLPKQFAAAAEQTRAKLNEVLTAEQMEALTTVFEELRHTTIEDIRDALVDRLTRFLALNQEQIERLRPVFRDEIQKRSELLGRLTNAPDFSFEEFRTELAALQEATRRRLTEALDPDQLRALEQRQQQLRNLIHEAYFGLVEP